MSSDDLFHKCLEEPRTVFGDGYLDLIGTATTHNTHNERHRGQRMGRTRTKERGKKGGGNAEGVCVVWCCVQAWAARTA